MYFANLLDLINETKKNADESTKVITKSKLKHLLENFQSIDEDVQDFIRNKAWQFSENKTASTYLLFDGTKIHMFATTKERSFSFLGANNGNPEVDQIIKALSGEAKHSSVSGLLIAQLAKNEQLSEKEWNSLKTWDFVQECYEVQQYKYPLIILDCKKELIKYYRGNGFIKIDDMMSSKGIELVTMIRKI